MIGRNVSAKDRRFNTNGSRFWTGAELRLLKELWGDSRLSIADIAKELGKISEGRTPIAVMGKGIALSLPARAYGKPARLWTLTFLNRARFEDHPDAPVRERPWRDGRYSRRPLAWFDRSDVGCMSALCAALGEQIGEQGRESKRERGRRARRRAAAQRAMEAAE